jgi:hypothetical protein
MSCRIWRADGEPSDSSRLQAQMLHVGMEVAVEELLIALALATANAISSTTLDDSPATRAGEGSQSPEPERSQPISSPAGPAR